MTHPPGQTPLLPPTSSRDRMDRHGLQSTQLRFQAKILKVEIKFVGRVPKPVRRPGTLQTKAFCVNPPPRPAEALPGLSCISAREGRWPLLIGTATAHSAQAGTFGPFSKMNGAASYTDVLVPAGSGGSRNVGASVSPADTALCAKPHAARDNTVGAGSQAVYLVFLPLPEELSPAPGALRRHEAEAWRPCRRLTASLQQQHGALGRGQQRSGNGHRLSSWGPEGPPGDPWPGPAAWGSQPCSSHAGPGRSAHGLCWGRWRQT